MGRLPVLVAVMAALAGSALAQTPVQLYPRTAPAVPPPAPLPPAVQPAPDPAPTAPRGIAVAPLPPAQLPRVQLQPGDDVLDLVQAFYTALARGDGQQANEYLVPEKRNQDAFEIASMTQFYSAMIEPLRVVGVGRLDPAIVRVQYTYTHQSGRHCDGVADVTAHRVGGRMLIERIRALSGC
ncbi:MAG TPA: hypothetical protein VD978_24975 [Azospirillum sp.]|nr:hypothetical protein [Azospirillum sp.]